MEAQGTCDASCLVTAGTDMGKYAVDLKPSNAPDYLKSEGAEYHAFVQVRSKAAIQAV
jgi:hypothetical protein